MSYNEFAAMMEKIGVATGQEYMKRWIAEKESVVIEVKSPMTPVRPVQQQLMPSAPMKPKQRRPVFLEPIVDPELGETIYPVGTMLQNHELQLAYKQSPVLFAALARDCSPLFTRSGARIHRISAHK
jgi:hypothetical protein